MTTQFTALQSESLVAEMPELQFNVLQDSAWTDTDAVQDYLNFYRINFSKTQSHVAHGFGFLNVCSFRVATHYWLPQNPRGTLVVMHGYYDHVGIFANAIAYGLSQGLAVLAFDLPGHGLSSGERVVIDSFDQYADVLEAVLVRAQDLLPCPYYAIGQSTGGAILLNHLWRYQLTKPEAQCVQRIAPCFHRMALCAPLILPRGWLSGRFLYTVVHKYIRYLKRGASRNSHDKTFIDFIDHHDHLQSKFLSVKWVGAMKAWNRTFRAFEPMNARVLVVQGTGDLTVAWRYNIRMIRRQLPKAEIHFIEGAGHQLINESMEYREQVFARINGFFFDE